MQQLHDYRISEETGAMLADPLSFLPEQYKLWNELAICAPDLYANGSLRKYIKHLPILDPSELKSHEEFRLAHKILAYAASCYVWQNGESDVVESLPPQLAVPLVSTSKSLGLQPIITHQDLVLGNCIKNSTGELACIHQPTPSQGWTPFITISGEIEMEFAPAYKLILDLVARQSEMDETFLANQLDGLCAVIRRCTHLIPKFFDRLDPTDFYLHLRPVLCGWSRGVYATGLGYTGLKWFDPTITINEMLCNLDNMGDPITQSSGTIKIACIGASAAQSIILQSLDAVLQIEHSEEDAKFFRLMRYYMIREHRDFLRDLEAQSKIRQVVSLCNSGQLKQSYKNCIEQLRNFRDSHLTLVARYVSKPSLDYTPKVNYIKFKGTGGQDISEFLKRVRDNSDPSVVKL